MDRNRDIARFEAKLRKADSGCWEWCAGKKGGGYGVFWLDGALRGAHRASLALYRGEPLETALDAMHSCDNPGCVNPDHLSYGTRFDNMRDASSKGRTVRVADWRGPLNPRAKLTIAQRQEVERQLLDGRAKREIADDFGITAVRVQQIAREAKSRGGGWEREEF